MDYSVNPWWVYVIAVVVVFGTVIGLPLWGIVASSRRARRQSVVIENGVVSVTDAAFGGARAIPVDRIGTVVYLPPREQGIVVAPVTSLPLAMSDTPQGEDYRRTQARALGNGANMFTNGGIIILDTRGRMIGHIAYEVGSHAPLWTVWKQIPAQSRVEAPLNRTGTGYSRAAFKRAFPKALRFGELWGGGRWLWTIIGFVFIGIPVAAFIVVFVMAFVSAWNETNG
ncbi:hypothetical protein [Humibacter ginsenosidimutans]|uniref:CN hydrolase domain-containing protein n=1 Tax=Humibacter ginsenosidimutans TaxID=2599293 RepID=A0A5B8M2J4_9MICO|nr:hypothetical protein [Humibacter ginsenosidimutans]QDZ15018.1 hypothetical protein FPZ11_09780 [Humibacter ginsenosidimutans]